MSTTEKHFDESKTNFPMGTLKYILFFYKRREEEREGERGEKDERRGDKRIRGDDRKNKEERGDKRRRGAVRRSIVVPQHASRDGERRHGTSF